MANSGKGGRVLGFEHNVFYTGVVSLLMDIGSEMAYPLVPLFLSSVLGVNKAVIGLIEGIAESTASVVRVFSGYVSDRVQRRKSLMVLGYGLSTLSRPLLALAQVWPMVLAGRFVDRVGKGVRGAPRDAIIANSSPREELGHSFGFHRAMDTVGAVIGPAVAFGLLAWFHEGYRTVFWLAMIPGVLAVAVVILYVVEPARQLPAREPLPRPRWGDFGFRYKAFVAIVALFAIGNSSDAFIILRAQTAGMPTPYIPLVYLSFNLIYALSSWPAGRLSDRVGPGRVIACGFLLFAAIYAGLALASRPAHIWALFPLYGLSMGLTAGVQKAYLGLVSPKRFLATAYGIFDTVVGLALLPASLIGGYLWDAVGPQATFWYGAATAAAAAFLLLILARHGTG
jgi:MFS family permease